MSQQLIGKPAEGGEEAEDSKQSSRHADEAVTCGGLMWWKALQGQQKKRVPRHSGEQQEQCAQ